MNAERLSHLDERPEEATPGEVVLGVGVILLALAAVAAVVAMVIGRAVA
jgi:hypothetical protein